jgi:hypothetical protein
MLIGFAKPDAYFPGLAIDISHKHNLDTFLIVICLIQADGIDPQIPRQEASTQMTKQKVNVRCDLQY